MDRAGDVEQLVKRLLAGTSRDEAKILVQSLLDKRAAGLDELLDQAATPTICPAPAQVRGFRVRVDLHGAKPPVWRRLELRGDLTLSELHDVIQVAMGWTDSHLHRFRTGSDYSAPSFVTHFDVEEGEEGVLEDDVRLDQLVAARADRLWYAYDFGDGWEHLLKVEEVLAEAPEGTRCLAGRKACPPEDCGGIWGYDELAHWVRNGYDDSLLPGAFDDAEHAREWLPPDWHPDHLDLDEVNAALAEIGPARRRTGHDLRSALTGFVPPDEQFAADVSDAVEALKQEEDDA